MNKIAPKCAGCKHCQFAPGNGNPNRYYCTHPATTAGMGARMVCRTERHSTEITIKTSPRWCPLREEATHAD